MTEARPPFKSLSQGQDRVLGRRLASVVRAQGPKLPQPENIFIDMGVSPERITLENRSRNTYENAMFSAAAIHAQARRAMVARDVRLSHAPRHGMFSRRGFRRDPLARGLPDQRLERSPLDLRAAFRRAAPIGFSAKGMAGPAGLPAFGTNGQAVALSVDDRRPPSADRNHGRKEPRSRHTTHAKGQKARKERRRPHPPPWGRECSRDDIDSSAA